MANCISFNLLLITLHVGGCLTSVPIPCCEITPRDTSTLPFVFEISKIIFNSPGTCKGVNVAQFHYKEKDSNVIKIVCANGFNLMSFFLNVLQSTNFKTTTHKAVIQGISQYRLQYAANFSVINTNTSQFKLLDYTSSTSRDGKVASRTRVGT
nr:glycoprotein L [Macronycteris gammaherpesvirus 1]